MDVCTERHGRYLYWLQQEVVERFQVNFPVLFRQRPGEGLMEARSKLLGAWTEESLEEVVQQLQTQAEENAAVERVSPQLSAVNNVGLMMVAALHGRMKGPQRTGWHERYSDKVETIARRCGLSAGTLKQYRRTGELMLESPVMACMLPSFVDLLYEPMSALLDEDDGELAEECAAAVGVEWDDGALRIEAEAGERPPPRKAAAVAGTDVMALE